MIDSQKHSDLTKDIMEWLLDNRNLPVELCVGVVKAKLSKANLDTETLLHYAAYSFIAVDDVSTFGAEGINKLSELIPLVQNVADDAVALGMALTGVAIEKATSDQNTNNRKILTDRQAEHLGKLKEHYIASPSLHTMAGASAARILIESSINADAKSLKYTSTAKLAGHIKKWRLPDALK